MERVLLWLDDLDDCCAISAHLAERLRRHARRAGLALAGAVQSAASSLPSTVAAGSGLLSSAAAVLERVRRRSA